MRTRGGEPSYPSQFKGLNWLDDCVTTPHTIDTSSVITCYGELIQDETSTANLLIDLFAMVNPTPRVGNCRYSFSR